MIKEILLSTILSCAIGVGAIPIDPTPNRAIAIDNYISQEDMINGYTILYNGYFISASQSYEVGNYYTNYLNTSMNNDINGLQYSCLINATYRYSWYENTNISNDELSLTIDETSYFTAPIFQIAFNINSSTNYLNVWVQMTQSTKDIRFVVYNKFNSSTPLRCYVDYKQIDTGLRDNRTLTYRSGNYDYYYFEDFDNPSYYMVSFTILNEQDYEQAMEQAYQNGYFNGKNDGYQTGYIVGKNDGLNEDMNSDLVSLFLSIADTPILMLRSLFDFNVLGVSLFVLFGGLITILVALFIIKKLI